LGRYAGSRFSQSEEDEFVLVVLFLDHNQIQPNQAFSTVSSRGRTMHDIVDTAVAAGSFKTLVAAVTAAGLGPVTVFAPSDEAFAKLPEGTVANLLKPENKAKLTAILTLHVMAGKVMAADVAGKKLSPASVEGEHLHVDGTNGVTVNGAKVVTADIACTNGVIHVIDAVLLPKA
jgi:uncharacterized surface protein with fasciclin (FAS1) repeats